MVCETVQHFRNGERGKRSEEAKGERRLRADFANKLTVSTRKCECRVAQRCSATMRVHDARECRPYSTSASHSSGTSSSFWATGGGGGKLGVGMRDGADDVGAEREGSARSSSPRGAKTARGGCDERHAV